MLGSDLRDAGNGGTLRWPAAIMGSGFFGTVDTSSALPANGLELDPVLYLKITLHQPRRKTWYLDPAGTDTSGCGTTPGSGACASLPYLTNNYLGGTSIAKPGDTIIFDCGTYGPQSVTFFNSAGSGSSATRSQAIQTTIKAATRGCVTLTPPPNSAPTSSLYSDDSFDILWDGFTIVGIKGRSDWTTGQSSPDVYTAADPLVISEPDGAADGSIVQYTTVSHALGSCLFNGGDDNEYLHDTFSDCGATGNELAHGMYLHGSNLVVDNNTINGSGGWCWQHYGAGGTSTFTDNTVENCLIGGFTTYQTGDTFVGNTVENNAGGVWLGASATLEQTVIADNSKATMAAAFDTAGHAAAITETTNMWNSRGIVGVNDGGQNEVWIASAAGFVRRFLASGGLGPNADLSTGAVSGTAGPDLTSGITSAVQGLVSVNANGSSNNEIWILNGTSNSIARYTPGGTYIGTLTDSHFNGPVAAAVDGSTVYILNQTGNSIVTFDTSGSAPVYGTTISEPDISTPSGIAVVPHPAGGNDLWIVNHGTSGASNDDIVRLTESGTLIGSVLKPQSDPGGQTGTCAQAQNPGLFQNGQDAAWFNNHVWITYNNGGVLEYNNDGTFYGTYDQEAYACGGSYPMTSKDFDFGEGTNTTSTAIPFWGAQRLAPVNGQLWLSVNSGMGENTKPVGIFGSHDNSSLIANNTLYQNYGTEIYQGCCYSPLPTYENNIVDGSGPADPVNINWSAATWDYNDYYNVNPSGVAASGGAHSLQVDPQFTNASAGNFSLQPGSPLIGAGTPISGLVLNSPPDLGAIQLGGNPTPTSTATGQGAPPLKK